MANAELCKEIINILPEQMTGPEIVEILCTIAVNFTGGDAQGACHLLAHGCVAMSGPVDYQYNVEKYDA